MHVYFSIHYIYTKHTHIHIHIGIFSDGNYQHPPGFCWDTNCYSGTDDTFIDNYSIEIPLESYTQISSTNQQESSTLQQESYTATKNNNNNDNIQSDNDNNIHTILQLFINQIHIEYNKTQGNNIAFKMGSDFHYSNAYMWYKNLDKLIYYINKYYSNKYNIFYSSPIQYTQAKYIEQNNNIR